MLQVKETVIGKWNNNEYTVLSKLGEGGVGAVYKVKDNKGYTRALKISKDINSITREFNMMTKLKSLKNVPRVYEIDDYERNENIYYFLVMEYIEGYNLKEIIKYGSMKVKEIIGIGIILLNILEKFYKMGYVYADLKPENIMIDKRGKKVNFIDFGGVVEENQGIKEYTPAYSILSWEIDGCNDYIAYLVFSVAMIITSMLLKKEFNPLLNNLNQIESRIKLLVLDNRFKKCLIKALRGEIKSIGNFKESLKKSFKECNSSLVVTSKYRAKVKTKTKIGLTIDVFFTFSMVFFLIVLISIGINFYFYRG
ncbi:AarF/UbiB family protein [Proteiniborus sp.]|uniref:protein kinase domain-containing protein n=1 Tax=Proteiniborus sp. TaxID=2079015 RepID=UPI0033333A29